MWKKNLPILWLKQSYILRSVLDLYLFYFYLSLPRNFTERNLYNLFVYRITGSNETVQLTEAFK